MVRTGAPIERLATASGHKRIEMFVEGENGLPHLREVHPAIIDGFDLCLHSGGMVDEPLSDLRRCPDLTVEAPVGAA